MEETIEDALELLIKQYTRNESGTDAYFVRRKGVCVLASLSFEAAPEETSC